MSLTYSQYVTTLSELMVVPSDNADFVAILPEIIDYAEQRIYRELDLLNTVVRDSANSLSSGSRNFTFPNTSGTFVVTNGLNVITPAGTQPDSGTRNQLNRVDRDFLDMAWPNSSGSGLPQYWAPITQTTCVVGPWPDGNYVVEVIGTQRPTPLSATNTSTFLSNNLPDLLVSASMVFASGYLKNFSAKSDDPEMAGSWETQTKILMASAMNEETRKKFAGPAWTSQSTGGPPNQPPRS